ncbi:hypothetical protein BGZ51_008234 [Haplosporangium sp. Z 767]|nr:hypothetical protein BGZ51_008234 [Haplosporangium sp. Z 767]KAF9179503.1 hypothetical protein BGZ50_006874 [Haplosporangium sp. Z 11]
MHALRPAAFLRSAFGNISASGPIACMHKNAASPSTAFLYQQTSRQLQQQRYASSGLATHFARKALKPSIARSSGIHSAFKNTSGVPMTPSRTMVGAGAAATCLFGPLIYSRSVMAFSGVAGAGAGLRIAHCAPASVDARSSYDPYEKEPIINTRELTFGTLMGLCSGYLFKKIGKMMMLVIGLGFVSLQLLTNSGYIHVNWGLIESRFKEKFDLDKDGKVTMNDARHGFRGLILLLTRNFQFKSTFVSGFVLGFKYG